MGQRKARPPAENCDDQSCEFPRSWASIADILAKRSCLNDACSRRTRAQFTARRLVRRVATNVADASSAATPAMTEITGKTTRYGVERLRRMVSHERKPLLARPHEGIIDT